MGDHGPDFLPPGRSLPEPPRPTHVGGWQTPSPVLPPSEAPLDQGGQPQAGAPRSGWVPPTPVLPPPGAPYRASRRRLPGSPAAHAALAIVLALALMSLASLLSLNHPAGGARTPTAGLPPTYRDAAELWQHTASDLRADVSGAEINDTPDGDFEQHEVIDAGTTWVLLTDDGHNHAEQAVALDPSTGDVRWRHELGNAGMCATDLLDRLLVCLQRTASDSASGLGTRWNVQELRPDTGVVVRQAEVAGWFCAVHVKGERIVLVEQQLPAPHAAVRALDAALHPAWRIDLRTTPNQRLMFSTDRIVQRVSNYPDGPALDRLRIRDLRPDLLAVWAGDGTVFLNPATGRLAGFPHCSRVQDDGRHVWCNEPDHAVAYALTGGRLVQSFRTPKDVRLAYLDGMGLRSLPAVFENDTGVVGIDPSTGRRAGLGLVLPPREAFGMSLGPQFQQVGDLTLACSGGDRPEDDRSTAFDARTLTVRWVRNDSCPDESLQWHGRDMVFDHHDLETIDPATGAPRDGVRVHHDWLVTVGDAVVGVDTDGIGRIRL